MSPVGSYSTLSWSFSKGNKVAIVRAAMSFVRIYLACFWNRLWNGGGFRCKDMLDYGLLLARLIRTLLNVCSSFQEETVIMTSSSSNHSRSLGQLKITSRFIFMWHAAVEKGDIETSSKLRHNGTRLSCFLAIKKWMQSTLLVALSAKSRRTKQGRQENVRGMGALNELSTLKLWIKCFIIRVLIDIQRYGKN